MPAFYNVKVKQSHALTLEDGLGDEVQIPGLSTSRVDARFIDFQLPSLHQAEVLGYDYATRLQAMAGPAPVVTSEDED